MTCVWQDNVHSLPLVKLLCGCFQTVELSHEHFLRPLLTKHIWTCWHPQLSGGSLCKGSVQMNVEYVGNIACETYQGNMFRPCPTEGEGVCIRNSTNLTCRFRKMYFVPSSPYLSWEECRVILYIYELIHF